MPNNPQKQRCTTLGRGGRPCRAWAISASDPPRCAAHAGRCAPFTPPDAARRCTARTAHGRPCRAWAIPAYDPPLCAAHAGRVIHPGLPADPARRCSQVTRAGRPCLQWAILGSEPPICSVHAGLTAEAIAVRRPRCTALHASGRPCRRWSVAGADPPLCSGHAGRYRLPGLPADPALRCSHLTRAGRPCRAWAIRGAGPPACSFHAGRTCPPGSAPQPGNPAPPASAHCTGLTAQGILCRKLARRGSQPPLCALHALPAAASAALGPLEAPPPSSAAALDSDPDAFRPRRCCHITARGRQCLKWALPGSVPPTCELHAGRVTGPSAVRSGDLRCTGRTGRGLPCRARAIAGSEPPLCPVHAGLWQPSGYPHALKHGFYSRRLDAEARTAAKDLGATSDLSLQIAVTRVILERLVEHQGRLASAGPGAVGEMISISHLIFRCTSALTRLVLLQAGSAKATQSSALALSQEAYDELVRRGEIDPDRL